jgi:hypothetical protein
MRVGAELGLWLGLSSGVDFVVFCDRLNLDSCSSCFRHDEPGIWTMINPSSIRPCVSSLPPLTRRSHRTSPPGTLREGSLPSSFPIHHPGALGSSPVKTSALAKRLDEEMEG